MFWTKCSSMFWRCRVFTRGLSPVWPLSKSTIHRLLIVASFSTKPLPVHARILDGRALAKDICKEISHKIYHISQKNAHLRPGLAVIQVGHRYDSDTFVKMKARCAKDVNIHFEHFLLPETATHDTIASHIHQLNGQSHIHGILLQLPLPSHLDSRPLLSLISPEKDVDGLHPLNLAYTLLKGYSPRFTPCTPQGILRLLDAHEIPLQGKKAVILGRSSIVGLPMMGLLLKRHATVQICHSKTPQDQLIRDCQTADLLVVAAGQPELVQGSWVKPGATVIDVGIHSFHDQHKITGDVKFKEVSQIAKAISPVPGGVGPMTVAMLMHNTLRSYLYHLGLPVHEAP